MPTPALFNVQVACEVLEPVTVPSDVTLFVPLLHVLVGLCANDHWILPIGGGVVLLGGITVAVKVRVSPRIGEV